MVKKQQRSDIGTVKLKAPGGWFFNITNVDTSKFLWAVLVCVVSYFGWQKWSQAEARKTSEHQDMEKTIADSGKKTREAIHENSFILLMNAKEKEDARRRLSMPETLRAKLYDNPRKEQ